MEKLHLVFFPSPLMGHIGQSIEFAQLLLDRFTHISVSVIVVTLPGDSVGKTYTDSLSSAATNRIHFHYLPQITPKSDWIHETPGDLVDLILEEQKPSVRNTVRHIISDKAGPAQVTSFIVDMSCTSMVDVGKEFGVKSYVFFTSNAGYLGFLLHLQTLTDKMGQDISRLKDSSTDIVIPSYATPVPANLLPKKLINKHWWSFRFLAYARKYREAKGIILNTFTDLEPHSLGSYDSQTPPVYPVGPLLKSAPVTLSDDGGVFQWLDAQPESSVVFLCFGSRGYFKSDQVKEIAIGLEQCGHRFLWSLRRPPTTGGVTGFPGEYENPNEVLPEGFVERTAGRGKVIGWAPQIAVLSHVALGGFVSHCGWNSTLESLSCGVAIATWPRYAEQQLNAHQLVNDLGLAVEISLYDQLNTSQAMVTAKKVEMGIRRLMDSNSEVKKTVKEIKVKSMMASMEGGKSYTCLQRLVDDMMKST